MTKAEILRYAKMAGLPLDESMTREELEGAFTAALVAQNIVSRNAAPQAQARASADPIEARHQQIEEARQKQEAFEAELTAKHADKIYAAICITGLPNKCWYRGKTRFEPDKITFFKVGDTTLNGIPMTGHDIELILEDNLLLVTEIENMKVDGQEIMRELLRLLPEREVGRLLEKINAQLPKTIKIKSEGLETPAGAPGIRVRIEKEEVTMTEEAVGGYGKEV